jgi:hypothetical protein
VVGFYSVSIPFFAVGHPLLGGCGKEDRFRVSFNFSYRVFVIFFNSRLGMFEYRVMRRVLVAEVTRGWRTFRNELRSLFYSPYVVSMMILIRMKLVGHVAHMRMM